MSIYMHSELNSCFNCRYCLSDLSEYSTWCSETGKIINDGFDEGDSDPCKWYLPSRNLYAFSYAHDPDEILPF